jgi:hypothetical protein
MVAKNEFSQNQEVYPNREMVEKNQVDPMIGDFICGENSSKSFVEKH